MARLIVDLDLEFSTPQFYYNHSVDYRGKVSSDILSNMLQDSSVADFGIEIASLGPEYDSFELSFPFEHSGIKKGGVFTYDIDQQACTAHVSIKATWHSAPLRKGVKEHYDKKGDNVDFRVASFIFKGGARRGFEGNLVQSIDDFKNLPAVLNWHIK
jgi:hypothetical protein